LQVDGRQTGQQVGILQQRQSMRCSRTACEPLTHPAYLLMHPTRTNGRKFVSRRRHRYWRGLGKEGQGHQHQPTAAAAPTCPSAK
jgi:hypothetical protein